MFTLIKLIINWNAPILSNTISSDLVKIAIISDSYNLYQYSIFDKSWWSSTGSGWTVVDQTMDKELHDYLRPFIIKGIVEKVKSIHAEQHSLHV